MFVFVLFACICLWLVCFACRHRSAFGGRARPAAASLKPQAPGVSSVHYADEAACKADVQNACSTYDLRSHCCRKDNVMDGVHAPRCGIVMKGVRRARACKCSWTKQESMKMAWANHSNRQTQEWCGKRDKQCPRRARVQCISSRMTEMSCPAVASGRATGKRDSIHHHLLEAVSETADVLESRQKPLCTTPSGWWWWWWWCIESFFRATRPCEDVTRTRRHDDIIWYDIIQYNKHNIISCNRN